MTISSVSPIGDLSGDAGLLVQSYGAAVLAAAPRVLAPPVGIPVREPVSPVASVASVDGPRRIDTYA